MGLDVYASLTEDEREAKWQQMIAREYPGRTLHRKLFLDPDASAVGIILSEEVTGDEPSEDEGGG